MPEAPRTFLENYREKHQHPINRALHTIGIPMIVCSLVVVFFDWRWGAGLFVAGWILQFAGHAVEGNQPAFFRNPVYLLIGPLWWAKKMVRGRGRGWRGKRPLLRGPRFKRLPPAG